jgi:hypothetical protein
MNDRLTELRKGQGATATLGGGGDIEMGGLAQPKYMEKFFQKVEIVKVRLSIAVRHGAMTDHRV